MLDHRQFYLTIRKDIQSRRGQRPTAKEVEYLRLSCVGIDQRRSLYGGQLYTTRRKRFGDFQRYLAQVLRPGHSDTCKQCTGIVPFLQCRSAVTWVL